MVVPVQTSAPREYEACGEDVFTAIVFPFQAVLSLPRFALRRQDTFFRLPHCIEADAEGSAVAAVCRASLPARTPPSAQAAGGGCMPRAGVPHSTNRFHEMTRAEGVSLRDWESEVG